uniref:Uncharacterized protein n=1 Tax=Oncorhynchus tshawytscha TaxID=74940 RepID=A0A8C8EWY7_ONCTS
VWSRYRWHRTGDTPRVSVTAQSSLQVAQSHVEKIRQITLPAAYLRMH